MNPHHRQNVIREGFLTDLTDKRNVYMLGRIWADAHVSFAKNSIKIECLHTDSQSVDSICAANGIITTYQRQRLRDGKPFGRLQYSVQFSLLPMKNEMLRWGYDTKACPLTLLQEIPTHLRHYWWRGYLDGDGGLYLSRRKVELAFWSTEDQDWSFVKKLFQELGHEEAIRTIRYDRKGGTQCSSTAVTWQQTAIRAFLSYAYQGDDVAEIGLSRKHAKYLSLLEREQKVLNRRAPRTSRYPHVSRRDPNHRWSAFIWRFNARLGPFDTEEEAHQAVQRYLAERNQPKETVCHRDYTFAK